MRTGIRPMEVQSNSLRDDLRQHAIPARASRASNSRIILTSKSRLIVVEQLRARSRRPASEKVQELADH
jgi:hypothetical protein